MLEVGVDVLHCLVVSWRGALPSDYYEHHRNYCWKETIISDWYYSKDFFCAHFPLQESLWLPKHMFFLLDPGSIYPLVRSMGQDVRNSLTICCSDLMDVTLADEDTNSIPSDRGNRAILGNVAMQGHVMPSGGQICNYSSGATQWSNFQKLPETQSQGPRC